MLGSLWKVVAEQPSKVCFWALFAVLLGATLYSESHSNGTFLRQDVLQYYSYVPAVFVHQDVSMKYCKGNAYYQQKIWGETLRPEMGPVQKYTIGMAVMYTPFFLAGHLHAHLAGWTPDGYTPPYRLWLRLGILAYLLIGLVFLRKLLRLYFSDWPVALVLVSLALGTNLLFYTIQAPGMPHTAVFMLVSMLMWYSVRFYAAPSWRLSFLIAAVASLLTIVRPNHLILWAIPALAGIASVADIQARLRFWKAHWLKLLIWPLVLMAFVTPQLLYWKLLTDQWIYYSYGEEGFFLRSPAIGKVLFSFRKGLLIYSPLMALGFAGMIWLRVKARDWALTVPLVVGMAGYVIASWWCWWYGGGFGNRAFIDLFPLLAVGMAAFFEKLRFGTRLIPALAISAFVAAFCFLNLFQSYQYHRGHLHHDSMTAQAYIRIFGRPNPPPGIERWFDAPDYDAALKGEPE